MLIGMARGLRDSQWFRANSLLWETLFDGVFGVERSILHEVKTLYPWGISCVFRTSLWFVGWGIYRLSCARFLGLFGNCNNLHSNVSGPLNPYFLGVHMLFPWLHFCIISNWDVSFKMFLYTGREGVPKGDVRPLAGDKITSPFDGDMFSSPLVGTTKIYHYKIPKA